jgi:hypothetical protein
VRSYNKQSLLVCVLPFNLMATTVIYGIIEYTVYKEYVDLFFIKSLFRTEICYIPTMLLLYYATDLHLNHPSITVEASENRFRKKKRSGGMIQFKLFFFGVCSFLLFTRKKKKKVK